MTISRTMAGMSRPSAPIAVKSKLSMYLLFVRRRPPDNDPVAVHAGNCNGGAGFDEAAVRYDIDASGVDLRNTRWPQRGEGRARSPQPKEVALRGRDVAAVGLHAGRENEAAAERQVGQHPQECKRSRQGQQEGDGDTAQRSDDNGYRSARADQSHAQSRH